MSLGMILAQPRHVLAKLNGLSSGEEHAVFERMTGAEWGPDLQPVFSVARCRATTTEVRNEPVATVRSATERLVARFEEQLARQQEQLASQQQQLDRYEQQYARNQEDNQHTRAHISGVWEAVSNVYEESTGLSPKEVGKKAGWSAQRVRKYGRLGWFPKSLPNHEKNDRYVFDPIKVLEDIADIKKHRLGKRHRKS